MLWRVRTTLEDRPGALAHLAQHCGDRAVNILALQIFPGIEGVTDELVLSCPTGWSAADVRALVAAAGGRETSVRAAPERALVDEPTRYLQAARQLQEGLVPVAEVLAHLLEARVVDGPCAGPEPVLELEADGATIRVQRPTAFTPTEQARAAALMSFVPARPGLGPLVGAAEPGQVRLRAARPGDHHALQRMHARCSSRTVLHRYGVPLLRLTDRLARHLADSDAIVAVVPAEEGEEMVGIAQAVRRGGGTTPEVTVLVEDDWQRRGLGSRLVHAALRQLAADGYREALLRGQVDNPGLVPLVARLGARVRVRVVGDAVTALLTLPAPAGEWAGGDVQQRGTAPGVVTTRG